MEPSADIAHQQPILGYETPTGPAGFVRAPIWAIVLVALIVPGLASALMRGTAAAIIKMILLLAVVPLAFLFFGPYWSIVLFPNSRLSETGLYPFLVTCAAVPLLSVVLAVLDRNRMMNRKPDAVESNQLIIKLAAIENLKAIVDIDDVAQSDSHRREFIARSIGRSHCYFAEWNGKVVAYAVLEYRFFENGFISMLYVAAEHRRKGIAAMLVRFLEGACRTPKLFTSTNASNAPMRQLLGKLDFHPSGSIENLDIGDPELIFFTQLKAKVE